VCSPLNVASPKEVRSPLNVAFNTRDAHGVQSRLALWDTAEHLNWDKVTEMPGRYFHFRLCQRGAPLAWVLSDQAQENLKNALSGCEKNQQQMDELTTLISSMSSSDKIPR